MYVTEPMFQIVSTINIGIIVLKTICFIKRLVCVFAT